MQDRISGTRAGFTGLVYVVMIAPVRTRPRFRRIMATDLEQKINAILDSSSRMVLATSVDGLSSSASVFFARDGDDLLFFTFNQSRKARQIRFNPRVQVSIWPRDEDGIRGLCVEGSCFRIRQAGQMALARQDSRRNRRFQGLHG